MSTEFIPVCELAEVPPGGVHVCAVKSREIAVYNIDGTLYAIDNTCPHAGGPLSDGWRKGTVVTCPWHAWSFDVTTGKMTLGAYSSVDTFAVTVEGTRICVAAEPNPRS